ncbi:MAG: hypothetical protein CBD63_04100 [Candidatus Pelagibacter sp. TMED203]|nr:MAG: hypothetical protein CBD63_04100 [Candidatus Pelagibacter sp. TMED203]|tara:strand:+ start:163 stop:396 length:234 start_codon:yes stop_codon:yes gene_type:complete
MKKLSDIVMELGKVQTDKDNPPFKTPKQIEKEGVTNPVTQKHDFSKPTVVHISKKEMEILHNDGRLETDGITIIADE